MTIAAGRFPSGIRRRLAMTFVLVAGAAAGALGLGAATVSTSYRHRSFEERSLTQAEREVARLELAGAADVDSPTLEGSGEPGGPEVVIISRTFESSVTSLGFDDLPSGLRSRARESPGELVHDTVEISGASFLVVGTHSQHLDADVFFFFPRGDVVRGLQELRVTLAIGWVAVVAGAAIVGTLVARRTLRPVREAAEAAHKVTEGLLATRLPAEGDDEFGSWASSFNEMVAALEDKIRALGEARDRERRFNGDLAHELRTPLGALVTAATHLEGHGDDLPPHLRRPVELVAGSSRRLHRLADELLELHRLEAGQELFEGEPLDLAEVVAAAVAAQGWDERVVLVVDDRPLVLSDARRIDRILVNLIGNAVNHGGEHIVVAVRTKGSEAEVRVTDDGPGIAVDDISRLFDRYYKVSAARGAPGTTSASGGSGLGLSIALEHAKLLGGTVEVASEPGAGSEFTVTLPVAPPDPGDPA